MKKFVVLLLAFLLCLSGCNKKETNTATSSISSSIVETKKTYGSLDEILEDVEKQADDVVNKIKSGRKVLEEAIGEDYEKYKDNIDARNNYYADTKKDIEDFISYLVETGTIYYKMIAQDKNYEEYKKWDRAIDKYYDAFDEALSDVYDAFDDSFSDLYRLFDDVISDAYSDRKIKYEEKDETWDEMYNAKSDAWDACYNAKSDGWSLLYDIKSAIYSAFYDGNNDVDAIVNEIVEEAKAKQEHEASKDYGEGIELEVQYEIENGKAIVTGCIGEGDTLTIDYDCNGIEVVGIKDSAFENCSNIKKVVIWADLEYIGNKSFKNCSSIIDFEVPFSTTYIGAHAFENCEKLEELILWGDPNIDEYAFANCPSLKEVNIGNDTKLIGPHAFENCTGIEIVVFWGIEEIGQYAFAGCTSIKEVSFPSDVKRIGAHAFDGCSNLESALIWGDSTSIEEAAFANCPKLTKVPKTVEYNNDSVNEETTQNSTTSTDIRPEFKEAIDSYEAWFDGYVAFMEEYNNSTNPTTLLVDYAKYVGEYADVMNKIDAIGNENMNEQELAYYTQAVLRITQKLATIGQ